MFYVITRRTIRNVILWVAAILVLGWIFLAYGLNRPAPVDPGNIAWGRETIEWFKGLWDRSGDDSGGVPKHEAPEHEPLEQEAPRELEMEPSGEVETSADAPVLSSKTVVIGDPWQYNEASGVASNEDTTLAVTGRTLTRVDSQYGSVNIAKAQPAHQFTEFRLERDISRSRQLEYLHGVLNNQDGDPGRKADAHKELMQIMALAETETNIENLLKASGIQDTVVFISEAGVSVVVSTAINREEAARIGSLVAKTAQVKEEQVRILDNTGI